MPIANNDDLLNALLQATTPEAVRTILAEIGDYADVELDQPFGAFGFCWHAYGDNQSNVSSIGLGTKPGRSLTERLTNAMDAILEDQVTPGVTPPKSPREAAKEWFGRPVSGREDGLFKWNYSENDCDRRIAVVIADGGEKSAPTVDVVDDGTGITPERFPNTILSLQASNKIEKWYVIGAFGQGGASTLRFSDFGVIVSRHREHPRVVGFTVVRVLRLSGRYKEDCYGYLCLRDGSAISVPSCQRDDPIILYPGKEAAKAPVLRKGTLVRHISYKLSKLEKALHSSPGNLYHYLHFSVFDPLLPFRIIDLRNERQKNEIVTGSRNRLMKLAGEETVESTIFAPFNEQVEKFTAESPALQQLFRTNYEIWIAYHAILQENSRADSKPASMGQEEVEVVLEAERTRVARMQVKQARETAQLMHRALKDQVPERALKP